jgi:hypothetical protein
MEEIKDYPTQDNDPRTDAEKPSTTHQMSYNYPDGSQLLVVLVGEIGSTIYFAGDPKDYKEGAVQSNQYRSTH